MENIFIEDCINITHSHGHPVESRRAKQELDNLVNMLRMTKRQLELKEDKNEADREILQIVNKSLGSE